MLTEILLFGFAAGLAALAGVYLVYFFGGWARRNLVYLISFAVGVLLANAFFHLLPEAVAITAAWPYWALGAVVFFYFVEQLLMIHACREEECEVHTIGEISFFGLGLHSLVDGLTIGIAFQAGFPVGSLAALAVIVHKISDGGCLYTLLLGGHFSRKKALLVSWLVALATPLGALLAYLFAPQLAGQALGWLLAAAAGGFIYIGASDLVPMTHKEHSLINVFLMILGVVFILVIGRLV